MDSHSSPQNGLDAGLRDGGPPDGRAPDPANTDADFYLRSGIARVEAGELDQAIADFSSALQLEFNRAVTSLSQAISRGESGPAAPDLEQARHTQARLADLYSLRGGAYAKKHDFRKAIEDASQAIQLDDTNPRYLQQRGDALGALGDHARAVADFRLALQMMSGTVARTRSTNMPLPPPIAAVPPTQKHEPALRPEAPPMVPPSVANTPPILETQLEAIPGPVEAAPPTVEVQPVAEEPESSWEPEPGAEEVDLELMPADESVAAEDVRQARDHYRQGEVFRSQRAYRQAVESYSEALRLDPCLKLAYLNRGQAHRYLGDMDAAWSDFSEVIRLDSQSAEAFLRRGNVHADAGSYDRAAVDYGEAIEIDPGSAVAYMNRGLAFAKLGEFARALEDLDAALQFDPRLAAAYFIRGTAHSRLGNFEAALADFDRLLQLEPRNALAYNERGLTLANQGEYARAIEDYNRAVALKPSLLLPRYNRIIANRLNGDLEAALTELDECISRKPNHAPFFHQRGLVHQAVGALDAAVADFATATQLDPRNEETSRAFVEAVKARAKGTRAARAPAESIKPSAAPEKTSRSQRAPKTAASLDLDREARPKRKTVLAPPRGAAPSKPRRSPQTPGSIDLDSVAKTQRPATPVSNGGDPATLLGRAPKTADWIDLDSELKEKQTAPPAEPPPPPVDPKVEAENEERAAAILCEEDETDAPEETAPPPKEEEPPRKTSSAGKISLECPECGACGKFEFNQLNKMIRCAGCSTFYRMDATGELAKIPPEQLPGIMKEVRSGLGGWRKKWVEVPAIPGQKRVASAPVILLPPAASSKKAPAKKPSGRRQEEEVGRFRRAGQWILAVNANPQGRWLLRGTVVAVMLFVGMATGSSFGPASDLRKSGEAVARSWLNGDADAIDQFVEPFYKEKLGPWMKNNVPPVATASDDAGAPLVLITVEENDGKYAKVLVRIKTRDTDGSTKNYLCFHRWVLRQGKWYFLPT